MTKIVVNCQGVETEAALWQLYLDIVQPAGARYFGMNIDAFWDAISAGGPGWPGDVQLLFTHTSALATLNEGKLLRRLQEIARESNQIQLVLHAA